jgi:phosphoglycolate phosphatase-like HAD superfamily hydrolase
MKKIRAVILDFDGVIAESNQVKDDAFAEFFSRFPDQQAALLAHHEAHHARPRREKFEYAAQLLGRPGDLALLEEMGIQFSALVSSRVIACPPVPGAPEFLREFSGLLPLYISSVTPQEELRAILRGRGLDGFFAEAYGNPPTPKALAIAQVLERERLQPGEVAFVGDSLSDYQAAAAAGLVFWGRDSGHSFAGADIALYPDLHAVAEVLRPLV